MTGISPRRKQMRRLGGKAASTGKLAGQFQPFWAPITEGLAKPRALRR